MDCPPGKKQNKDEKMTIRRREVVVEENGSSNVRFWMCKVLVQGLNGTNR